MRRLVVRIWISVAVVLVAAAGAVPVLVALSFSWGDPAEAPEHGLAGLGASWAAADVARTPPEQREARLDEIRRHFRGPVRLVPPDPARKHQELVGGALLRFPVDATADIEFGPFPRPSPPRTLTPVIAVWVTLTTLALALVVAIPLTRRLRRLELGILALEGQHPPLPPGEFDDEIAALERSLAAAGARLRRRLAEQEELLQAVSHEIGTPLSRMRFELDRWTKLHPGPDPLARSFDEEIGELEGLAAEVTAWVEADTRVPVPRRLPLAASLADLVELESNRSNRGIAVAVDAAPPDLALWVEPRTFERAVENVVRNALRYAVARVAVRVRVEGERLWIAVGDDGPGIPAEARQRVLEPFTRLDPARGREHGGFGLGLAITRRIVERHGGEVRIGESELGGAEVRTSWPIAGD